MDEQGHCSFWICFGMAAALGASVADGQGAVRIAEAEFESLWSPDILLTHGSLSYDQKGEKTECKLSLAHSTIDLEYEPAAFDFLGFERSVDEDRDSVQLSLRHRMIDPVVLLVSGGFYDGFTTYRSAWLNEYYRQQYQVLPGYKTAEPDGKNMSAGVRWEYAPGSGFAQFDASYLEDEIAPGYEIDFDGLRRGRPNLYTSVFNLQSENVVSRRVRVLNELRLVHTTGRERRWAYQGSVNVAIGERWVLRSVGGYTREEPRFEAFHIGSTLEFELAPSCLLSVGARYYNDTGEIENSLLVSNAAPGVEAYQVVLGLRRLWENASLKVLAGPYFMRYEQPGLATLVFRNLYRDRDWANAQVAYSVSF